MSWHSKWRALGPLGLGLLLGAFACSVDDRELTLDAASGGDGATSGSGVADAGSEAGGGSPVAPELPLLVDGCADLDTDGMSDCSMTLVYNAAFKTDVTGWEKVGDSKLEWSENNALDDQPSGSAMLNAEGTTDIDGSALFRASQCIAAGSSQLVIAYANAWVAKNTSPEEQAHAELQVSYFDAANCNGSATGYFVTPPSSVPDAWVTIHAGGVSGPATQSILVMLVGVKPYRTKSMSARFDNVMVKLKSP